MIIELSEKELGLLNEILNTYRKGVEMLIGVDSETRVILSNISEGKNEKPSESDMAIVNDEKVLEEYGEKYVFVCDFLNGNRFNKNK